MAIPQQTSQPTHRFNIDFLAIAIALALATLIRLNILPQITW